MSENKTLLQDFAASTQQNNQVWGLRGEDGWAVCDSIEFEETDVLPFFSTEAAALKLCVDEWQAYTPASFSLEEFLEDWLPGMHEDHVMVGIQWDNDQEDAEFEPADVAEAFT